MEQVVHRQPDRRRLRRPARLRRLLLLPHRRGHRQARAGADATGEEDERVHSEVKQGLVDVVLNAKKEVVLN